MRPEELPKAGVIQNYSGGEFFGEWSNLEGRDVLCLGMSEDQITQFVACHRPNSIHTLAYWADHIDAQTSSYPLVIGDITKQTEFNADQFDTVLSLSVLEHVSDLSAAFCEMKRITKPGGEMLHMFGPAWSCAYGHHLYCGSDDPNLNFAAWELPAHMHLLCDETEVCGYYERLGYDRHVGAFVFDQFHVNDHINRAFYEEYTAVLARFSVARAEGMWNTLPPAHIARLRSRFPGRRDFSTYGGRYRLIN